MAKKAAYTEESISQLKGADRVRKRPAVIFGSDGIDGCQHAVFEILSNSIDEAREGHGDKIIVTRFLDKSIEVQDFGRGIPMDYNENEQRYNWELVFCELYAGGKYNTNSGGSYEYSLGLNGWRTARFRLVGNRASQNMLARLRHERRDCLHAHCAHCRGSPP